MEYSDFKEKILDSVKELLPDTLSLADVKIQEVIKNNDIRLDGLMINDHTGKPMPTVYLNDFYKDLTDKGRSFEDILKAIVDTIITHMHGIDLDLLGILQWENVKSQVVPRIINRDKNKELVKQRPHMDITDLTKIYAVNLGDGMSIPITNELLDTWRISLSELDDTATLNISGQSKFRGLSEILIDMMGEEVSSALGYDINSESESMYVLSNNSGLFGASQMLDTNLMDSLSARFPEGFVILPSSTHEVIIVPIDNNLVSKKELEDIVRQVNSTVVSASDFLSDNIYKYNNNTHSIERLDLCNRHTHELSESISQGR